MTARNERGFTVIELIVSITILAVIGAALTESIIIGLRTTDNTSTNLGASSDAGLLASYFGSDAQSSSSTTGPACGSGGVTVVNLSWTDPRSADAYVISYSVDGGDLVRRVCLNGNAAVAQHLVRDVTAATCDCAANPRTLSVTAGGFSYQVDGLKRVSP